MLVSSASVMVREESITVAPLPSVKARVLPAPVIVGESLTAVTAVERLRVAAEISVVLPLVETSMVEALVEALARADLPAKPAAKAGAEEVPVLWKKTVLPQRSPMKASRSPSPSMSAKTGAAARPTLLIPKGLAVESSVKSGAAEVPVLLKKAVVPSVPPIKASRSPSPSISTKSGAARVPTSLIPKALVVEPPEKSGAAEVPVFRKKTVVPLIWPMKASRSPSASMSAKTGVERSPTSASPKGLVVEPPEKSGAAEVPVFRKKTVLPTELPMKASRSPSPSISTKSGEA